MYLCSLDHHITENLAGAKGYHLSLMKAAGFPVPEGFIVKSNAFTHFYLAQKEPDATFKEELIQQLNAIGANAYMVRSSAIGEDGAETSFAGQLDSFICSGDTNAIISDIIRCWQSYEKENVAVYGAHKGKQLAGMAVVVQKLIDPDYAGVIFTRSHLHEGQMLAEYVEGHGEALVSGQVNPASVHYHIATETLDEAVDFNLKQGFEIARKLELHYGYPLDVEWAVKENLFYVVQSRPITTVVKELPQYWSNTNVNENYPDPISPLLYSIARDSYYHYFKNLSKLFQVNEHTIRSLEGAYTNIVGVWGCHMYYNMSSIHEIISQSPFSEMLMKSFDNFVGYTAEQAHKPKKASFKNKLRFVRDFVKFNFFLEKNVSYFEHLVNGYSKQAKEAVSLQELKKAFHGFIEIRMHSWYRASLADFFAMVSHGILGAYCKLFYKEEGVAIHNKLIQAIPNLISSEPIIDTHRIKLKIRENKELYAQFQKLSAVDFYSVLQTNKGYVEVLQLVHNYLENWGYRCSGELMLTHDNYTENPALFIALLQQYNRLPDNDPEALIQQKYKERQNVIRRFQKKIISKYHILFPISLFHLFILHLLIKLASNGISSRERARLKQALLYFRFKQVIQKIGRTFVRQKQLKDPEDILFLRYQEIAESLSSAEMLPVNLKNCVAARKEAFKLQSKLAYPDDFQTFMGSYPSPDELVIPNVATEGSDIDLKGLSACGGIVKGRAMVLASVLEADKLLKGDILVTRQTDPGWVVVFPLISGLIVERGGMLSHGAIVSREFGIPAIVGVPKATTRLKDGDQILLNANTGHIAILDENTTAIS
ncbi:PEP/pyruvate-binding domain-containing protein [Ascidiimonas sp. W6]|uniref:PEP/pyruvate-binding domain-containing protein n=1 Tax=Ascidiimonas meishanensis TaxID=3128903 RepID=UPI0030EE4DAE